MPPSVHRGFLAQYGSLLAIAVDSHAAATGAAAGPVQPLQRRAGGRISRGRSSIYEVGRYVRVTPFGKLPDA